MINWTLEVDDVACPDDDMKKINVFTFLCSESDGMESVKGEQRFGVRTGYEGRVHMPAAQVL
jgi:hypothetical protein